MLNKTRKIEDRKAKLRRGDSPRVIKGHHEAGKLSDREKVENFLYQQQQIEFGG